MRKGVITKVDSNTTKMQTVQVEGVAGEISSGVERYQAYGMTSFPKNIEENGQGAEVLIEDIGGASVKAVVATDDRRYRPITGNQGDVIIYSSHDTPTGTADTATHRITLTDDGGSNYRIVVKVGSTKFEMKSDGTINITATTVNVNANVNFTGALTSNGKNISNTHTHSGVQAGGSNTGSVT